MVKNEAEAIAKRWDNRFRTLTASVSVPVALYILCAANDVAFRTDIEATSWIDYNEKLKKRCAGAVPFFKQGVTDIRTAIKESFDNTERWIAEWGEGSESKPYTERDYRRLDEIFSTLASRPEQSGGMDALQDFNLHTCAKLNLLAEKCIAKGGKDDLAQAEKAINTARKILEDEQLRKKDTNPYQEITLDGIVDRLRKDGLSGEMSFEEVLSYIARKTRREGLYDFDVDAAEHMLLCILNTGRTNNDEPELEDLPPRMRFSPEVTRQFSVKPNEVQEEVYDYLGLQRFPRNKTDRGGGQRV